ncbi:hypothetical protein [Arthrobacter sp. NPDC056727]|uniref:hypothetical protein n=1 Tax=Arthrobacter sp. NPDC056727 TaxID=3345927 RepID=UPI0036706524
MVRHEGGAAYMAETDGKIEPALHPAIPVAMAGMTSFDSKAVAAALMYSSKPLNTACC